jgi:hypothetical protein
MSVFVNRFIALTSTPKLNCFLEGSNIISPEYGGAGKAEIIPFEPDPDNAGVRDWQLKK